MRFLIALFLIALTAGACEAGSLWVNNITVSEYGMTWSYNETFTGADSIAFRVNIDSGLGDNNSFVNAWEVLLADKETRKEFKNSLDKEPDVKINNKTNGVEVVDVESVLSPDLIGKTHRTDTIVNKYSIAYRFRDSILNAGSIWFLGQANSPVTIVMPQGVDVKNISGMDNATMMVTDHAEISGYFRAITKDRGEITLRLAKNTSLVRPEANVSNATSPVEINATQVGTNNSVKPMFEMLDGIRNLSIAVVGFAFILLIYVFKVKKQ
ncbi:Uncharacterised protein [uncultured archaeon]|nr:Uncharacterised protein [uncultured archaeon]